MTPQRSNPERSAPMALAEGTPLGEPSLRPTLPEAGLSDDLTLREVRDLLLRVADRREDVLVVLAELGRGSPDGLARVAPRHRMPEDREIPELRGFHRL